MVFELQDIARLAKAARAHGAISVIDNSWATPVFQKLFACILGGLAVWMFFKK